MRSLIKAGADVNYTSKHGTPLSLACANGHSEVVEHLLGAGSAIAPGHGLPNCLAIACHHKRRKIIESLSEALIGSTEEEQAYREAMYVVAHKKDSNLFLNLLDRSETDVESIESDLRRADLGDFVDQLIGQGLAREDARAQ